MRQEILRRLFWTFCNSGPQFRYGAILPFGIGNSDRGSSEYISERITASRQKCFWPDLKKNSPANCRAILHLILW